MELSALNPSASEQGQKVRTRAARWVIVLLFLVILATGVAESLLQKFQPDESLLAHLHARGYLMDTPVAYEPSKGIWFYAGWAGASMMLLMLLYSLRKRVALLRPLGRLPKWLSFHMFLGVMGPLLITFHTTFKFGGIIATSYFCMIITMVSGLLGRYLYVQIPRSISGMELQSNDIDKMVGEFDRTLNRISGRINLASLSGAIGRNEAQGSDMNPASSLLYMIRDDITHVFMISNLRKILRTEHGLDAETVGEITSLLKMKAALIRRKAFLSTSHKLLHYWHVFHLPLAVVMFLIMFLHIFVYYMFRPAA